MTDDELDAAIADEERAAALAAMADDTIADLDLQRAIEGDPTAEARARHLADLERETAAQPFGRVLPFRRV
jgi:uncharacterized protein YicC (UPF0701 family)